MPNVTVTPAALVWSGGELTVEPVRTDVIPAILSWSGGFIIAGPGTGTALNVAFVKLDRLRRQEQIVNKDATPSQRLQTIWQRTMEAIEAALRALQTQVNDNTALLSEIRAAQVLAQTANDNALATAREVNIATSYPDPPGVLTAGSDGTVNVAAHNRIYADGSSVAVGAGSVSGFAPGDNVTVYYQDAAREGGAVTYLASTSPVAQGGDTHVVGVAPIPAAGQPSASGIGVTAPGVMTEEQARAYYPYAPLLQ